MDDGAGGRVPYRTHIEALARIGDLDAEAELAAQPKLPPAAAHLWDAFHQLHATRGGNGFTLNPISRMDLRLWQEDECRSLEGWEKAVILRLDSVYRLAGAQRAPDDNSAG